MKIIKKFACHVINEQAATACGGTGARTLASVCVLKHVYRHHFISLTHNYKLL